MNDVWTLETLKRAVAEAIGAEERTVAVSWADGDGNAVSRRSWPGTPPQLAIGACVRSADAEERIRELPGFVRLTGTDETDFDGDPYRAVRAVFGRTQQTQDDQEEPSNGNSNDQ